MQIVVPRSLAPAVLDIVHRWSGSPHLRIEKTHQNVRGKFFWKNMLN